MKQEIDMKSMQDNAGKAEAFLKSLASRHRLLILCQLATGPKSVNALISATNIAQTSMSQHLKKLRDETIVDYEQDHRTLYYRIINDTALKVMGVLYDEYCQNQNKENKHEKHKGAIDV